MERSVLRELISDERSFQFSLDSSAELCSSACRQWRFNLRWSKGAIL